MDVSQHTVHLYGYIKIITHLDGQLDKRCGMYTQHSPSHPQVSSLSCKLTDRETVAKQLPVYGCYNGKN